MGHHVCLITQERKWTKAFSWWHLSQIWEGHIGNTLEKQGKHDRERTRQGNFSERLSLAAHSYNLGSKCGIWRYEDEQKGKSQMLKEWYFMHIVLASGWQMAKFSLLTSFLRRTEGKQSRTKQKTKQNKKYHQISMTEEVRWTSSLKGVERSYKTAT